MQRNPLDQYRSAFPGYEVDHVLGHGGAAVVFRAVEQAGGKQVAIKLLIDTTSSAELMRFEREAKAYAALSHPNLLKIHASHLAGALPFLVLEYIPGKDLRRRLTSGGKLDPVGIGSSLASAVACLHQSGILHRDIKPSNVMLRSDSDPVLSDLGLAKRVQLGAMAKSSSGNRMGTLGYFAPERLNGGIASAASDVYSLALVLYEIAAGRCIFSAPAGQGIGPIDRSREPPPSLASAGIKAPPRFAEALSNCLSVRPEERPSADALVSCFNALKDR